MIYIFDTSSFIVIGHYFPERFPSFWERFEAYVDEGKILSVREVLNELEYKGNRPHLQQWIKDHKNIFLKPSREEADFVQEIFSSRKFEALVSKKNILQGKPVADPFIVASAKIRDGCVVTEEAKKDNASRIPNVCEHFKIRCENIEGFMKMEGWSF